jgi:hypothetical protein
MSRTPGHDGDQLSLMEQRDAEQAATVDQVVSQDQPSRPRATRARQRRPRGTGAVIEKGNRWYGQWYVRGRLVKRSLGPVREPGSRDGPHPHAGRGSAASADAPNGLRPAASG